MKRGIELELSGGACSLLAGITELAQKLGALHVGEKDKADGRRAFSVV